MNHTEVTYRTYTGAKYAFAAEIPELETLFTESR